MEKPPPRSPVRAAAALSPFPGPFSPGRGVLSSNALQPCLSARIPPGAQCSQPSAPDRAEPLLSLRPSLCRSLCPGYTAPSPLSSANPPPPRNLAPLQHFLQAEHQSQAIEHLSAAVNPSRGVFGTSAVLRLSLSGFLQSWSSPHGPIAASQRRFVGGIKSFPFICINQNPLAWLMIVGTDRSLEQTCQELGREKNICI